MVIKIRWLLFFLLLSKFSFAQRPDSLFRNKQTIDSVKKIVVDSVKKILDTNKVSFRKLVKVVFTDEPSPKKRPALKPTYRSLVLPGWGQTTNKQAWIIPIIYGGAGVGAWNFWNNHHKYLLFRNALTTILVEKKVAVVTYQGSELTYQLDDSNRLLPAVKGFRRNRDLTSLGFFLGWALQAVQANVSAHLKSFDMSEDISLKIQPNIQTGYGNVVGVKVNFQF